MNAKDDPPRPEELSAYIDGELDLVARLHVQRWLAGDPEASREVEAQRYLAELWDATRPAQPTDWDWTRSAERCAAARQTKARSWRRALPQFNLQTATTTALAATLLLAIIVGPLPSRPASSTGAVGEFQIADPADVHIISADPADIRAFPIGDFPMPDEFDPVLPKDFHVISLRPDTDGAVPLLRLPSDASAPVMIVPGKKLKPARP